MVMGGGVKIKKNKQNKNIKIMAKMNNIIAVNQAKLWKNYKISLILLYIMKFEYIFQASITKKLKRKLGS